MSRGVNVKALHRMLGHASVEETLDTGADLFEDDPDGVAAALGDVLAPTCGHRVGTARKRWSPGMMRSA